MDNNLQYTGLLLDRADALRREPEVIEQFWQGEQSLVTVMCAGKSLFLTDTPGPGQVEPLWLMAREVITLIPQASHRIFLGQEKEQSYFALELAEEHKSVLCEKPGVKFIDLRSVGALLARDQAAVLAYARAMLFWRDNHKFCSRCGSGVAVSHGGHVLKCINTECRRETYPRTDPAVIMLVEHTGVDGVQRCLLGRHPNWYPGSFSTLAGFVEPGESLEDAVRREVAEESGVVVGQVSYAASQPWPFPASIMLGFFAQALKSDICLDPQELAEAYWFSRAELAAFGEWGDENHSHNLPRKDSISRFLIDEWLLKGD
ncbi:MAG: NAD(+) diphosphatase [Thiolinea sp.]